MYWKCGLDYALTSFHGAAQLTSSMQYRRSACSASPSIRSSISMMSQGPPALARAAHHTQTLEIRFFSWATRASYSLFLFVLFLIFIFCFDLDLHVPLDRRSTYRKLCIGSGSLPSSLFLDPGRETCKQYLRPHLFPKSSVQTCGQLVPQGRFESALEAPEATHPTNGPHSP